MTQDATRLDRVPAWTAPAILLGVPLLVWIITKIQPRFYDTVVFRYYWGPIVADALPGSAQCSRGEVIVSAGARGCTDGGVLAFAGYNMVNTLTWAALLGVCILGTAQMLNHFRTPMDSRLIIAATAWVIPGSVWHVMQDVDLFAPPLEYLFITPPIYLLFAAGGILSFLIAHYARAIHARAGLEAALMKIWFIQVIGVLLYVALWAKKWDMVHYYANPVWVAAFAAAAFFVIRYRATKTGRIDPAEVTLVFALPFLALAMVVMVAFLQGHWGTGTGANALEGAWLYSTLGAAAISGVTYMIGKQGTGEFAVALRRPINQLIIFSHALDGLATAIGIDLIGTYSEKHVVSEAIRQLAENLGASHPTFMAFLPVKVLVALLVIYATDVRSKDDLINRPTTVGLVKFAIIMVGIGPGVRNMVRMSMGV